MKNLCALLLLLATNSLTSAQVTVESILKDTVDLASLTRRPNPYYKSAQASSYDRKSLRPGTPDWFANGDAGQFLWIDEHHGRKERVMADLKGPGAVVRIWSANPAGTIRFYFDGEDEPRWSAKTKDLLGGKVAPFGYPFAYEASMGWDFYAPLPYAKSLRITVDDTDGEAARNMYYHVGYRTYAPGTPVRTFRPQEVTAQMLSPYARQITRTGSEVSAVVKKDVEVQPGRTVTSRLPRGANAVTTMLVRVHPVQTFAPMKFDDPMQVHNMLRSIILEGDFDGEACTRAPLGDFFGAAPGINPYQGFPMEVRKDGTMICRFVMPYSRSGEIRFRNVGPVSVHLTYTVGTEPYRWSADSYHFKAQWTGETGRTRPMRDMNFLEAKGEGIFVGDNMHISNPVPAWWGEGDEKIYVDGETFPSFFGTGTEDYYGYAWCAPIVFSRPFHAEPRADSPGNFGQCSVNRWHIIDAIPFRNDFRFDIEMWHWADVVATYVHTAYWYAKPGGTPPLEVDKKLLPIHEMKPPAPVKGAFEGESFKIVSKTGGVTERQEGFWETSGGAQLWWRDAKPGDKLTLTFAVKDAGFYGVEGNFCHARDYGIHRITINGKSVDPIDFYSSGLGWKKQSLGVFELPKGEVTMTIEVTGTNPAADPKRYMFGLDYWLLKPIRD